MIQNNSIAGPEIHRLYAAFHSGGLASFLDEYESMRHSNLKFRLISDAMECLLPIRALSRDGLFFEDSIGKIGIAGASRQLLEKWGFDIRYEMSGDVMRILNESAFLSYGNHTSGIESVLFDSMFERRDVYQIGASFLAKIGPNISKTALLVENSTKVSGNPRSWRNRLLDSIDTFIWPPVPEQVRRERNRETIDTAVRMIVNDRCGVNVFPAGSVKADAVWQNGVGSLVKRLLTQVKTSPSDIYIVPLIYGMESTHLLTGTYFPPFALVKILARIQTGLFVPKPYIFAPLTIPLESLEVKNTDDVPTITAKLKRIWLDAQQMAHRKFSKWKRL